MDLALVKKMILSFISNLEAIYVYGSRARGTANDESDLDLAVLATKPIEPDLLTTVRTKLQEECVNVDSIDLVDISVCPLTLSIEILKDGKTLAGENSLFRARFETRILSAYAMLNEERKEILKDVQERGSVYAR